MLIHSTTYISWPSYHVNLFLLQYTSLIEAKSPEDAPIRALQPETLNGEPLNPRILVFAVVIAQNKGES